MRSLLPAAALGLLGLLALLPTALQPRPGAAVLALFPPGYGSAAAFSAAAEAGWHPVEGIRPNLLLLQPTAAARRPAGAWLVVDAAGARGCVGRIV